MQNRDTIDALRRYMELRHCVGEMESAGEDNCRCNANEFHTCEFCSEVSRLNTELRRLLDCWADNWAVLLERGTLPFQAWCECGHVSGQHGLEYPHLCTVENGCENDCYGFRYKVGTQLETMRLALEQIASPDQLRLHTSVHVLQEIARQALIAGGKP